MIDLPRHPLYNMLESPTKPESHGEESHDDAKPVESDGSSAYYGRRRYLDSLRRYEYWDELIEACRSGYIELAGPNEEQGDVHVNLGIAHYARGEVAAGDRELASLRRLFAEERAKIGASLAAVRKVPPGERFRAVGAIARRYDDPLGHMRASLVALESYHRLASGFYLNRTQLVVWLGVLLALEVAVFWLLRHHIRLALFTVVPALAVSVWLIHAHWALVSLPDTLTDVDLAYLSRKLLEAETPESAERVRANTPKTVPRSCWRRRTWSRSFIGWASRTKRAARSMPCGAWPGWPISTRPPLPAWRPSLAISDFRPIGGSRRKFKRRWPAGRRSPRWARCCGARGRPRIGDCATPLGANIRWQSSGDVRSFWSSFSGGAACIANSSSKRWPNREDGFPHRA